MKTIKKYLQQITKPVLMPNLGVDIMTAVPRIFCGAALAFGFGSDKFGMPWTPPETNLALFEIVDWFPKDVEKFGGIFAKFPVVFAWLGGFSEAVGGLFLMVGLQTRVFAFLIMCTMLVAIFFQKWEGPLWHMLPALGFLWVSIYAFTLGSGKIGVDYLLTRKKSKST